MLSTELLTTEDLDEIGRSHNDQPLSVAADLVDAVDRGLVAEQADAGYALMLAAEITKLGGDLQAAEVLAGRAGEAYRAQGDPDSYARAFRAELLLRLGREDEGMAELTALRPLLVEEPDVVSGVMVALEEGGYAETAQQWLTEALVVALHRHETLQPQGQQACKQVTAMVFVLARERYRLRRELDLPLDEHDELAERLLDAVDDPLGADEPDLVAATLLFWPQHEFDRLLQRWPEFTEDLGHNWDEYRTRNDPCWCGSAMKYKKCCLLRTRT